MTGFESSEIQSNLPGGVKWSLPKVMTNHPGLEWFLVGVVIAAGVAFRGANLDAIGFWCDEAESSINALTILQHGYPTDHYLGLPIYENTLVQPWPHNPEYEFKDISYSDKGVAVYHGWLPLYAIAASFALHHIQPSQPKAPREANYNLEDWKRITRAGRLPGVVIGGIFLVFAFLAGTAFYGRDAGWIALLSLSFDPKFAQLSGQARYYSAAVALSTSCCLIVWMMVSKRRWRDFLVGGLLFVLLFHTHLLSFVGACAMLGLLLPIIIYRNPKDLVKIGVFGSIVAAGTVPWLFLTGFYQHQSRIPRGWSLLSLPADFLNFPPSRPIWLGIPCLFLLFLLFAWASSSVPARVKAPLVDSLLPLLFLAAWSSCCYALFLLFMPAASFFIVNISYWGPAHLVIPLIAAALTRAAREFLGKSPSTVRPASDEVLAFGIPSPFVAACNEALPMWAIAAGLLLAGLSSLASHKTKGTEWSGLDQIASCLQTMNFQKDTRLYASPNDHLVLSLYMGLPFQSIAPVRKNFLDRYSGDVVIVQRGVFDWEPGAIGPKELQTAAAQSGQSISGPDAEGLSALLRTRDFRQKVVRDVTGAPAIVENVPSFAVTAYQRYEENWRAFGAELSSYLITRGFTISNGPEFAEVFWYRFVDPNSRRGPKLNYAARLRGAQAYVLTRSGSVVYRSPGRRPRDAGGIDFTLVK
jgi:hypothetical protein